MDLSIITKIINMLEGSNSRFKMKGQRISELKDHLIEIIQSEIHREKKNRKKIK